MIVRISSWAVHKLSTIHLNHKSSENFRPGKTFLSLRRSKLWGSHSIAEIRDDFTCSGYSSGCCRRWKAIAGRVADFGMNFFCGNWVRKFNFMLFLMENGVFARLYAKTVWKFHFQLCSDQNHAEFKVFILMHIENVRTLHFLSFLLKIMLNKKFFFERF